MKEQTLEGFKNKYGLSGLHSQPTGYMKFEDKTEEVFKDVELLINKTREETIRDEIKRKEEMIITKDNAEELVHTPLCKENPEKGNNHFFCNITNADYFRNQVILEDIKYLKEILNKLKK